MSGKTLDRSRNFGTVLGASDGSLYYQDGCCFNGDGQLVGAAPAGVTPETLAPTPGIEPASAGVSREELQSLHPAKIKKLVEMAGLELETGQGSKARNIENLLAAG